MHDDPAVQREAYKTAFPQFKTKAQLEAEVKRVLHSTTRGRAVKGSDEILIRKIIDFHPEADEKIGAGVAAIEVRSGLYGTPSFWIVRTDGSETDFSYRRCLAGKQMSLRAEILSGMRHAVAAQIEDFRRTCGDHGIEVHHEIAFSDMAASFLEAWEGKEPQIVPSRDGKIGSRLVPGDFAAAWTEHHAKHAILKAVSKAENAAAETERRATRKCPACRRTLDLRIVGTRPIEGRRGSVLTCGGCGAIVIELGPRA